MKSGIKRSRLLCLLVVFMVSAWTQTCEGQHIHEVLVAVQERRIVLSQRARVEMELKNKVAEALGKPKPYQVTPPDDSSLIDWGYNLSRMPSAQEVANLGIFELLQVLNKAVDETAIFKAHYLNFDPRTLERVDFINWSAVPKIGKITEDNWRSKLRLLASQLEQMRAVTWPYEYGASELYVSVSDVAVNPSPEPSFPFPDEVGDSSESFSENYGSSRRGVGGDEGNASPMVYRWRAEGRRTYYKENSPPFDAGDWFWQHSAGSNGLRGIQTRVAAAAAGTHDIASGTLACYVRLAPGLPAIDSQPTSFAAQNKTELPATHWRKVQTGTSQLVIGELGDPDDQWTEREEVDNIDSAIRQAWGINPGGINGNWGITWEDEEYATYEYDFTNLTDSDGFDVEMLCICYPAFKSITGSNTRALIENEPTTPGKATFNMESSWDWESYPGGGAFQIDLGRGLYDRGQRGHLSFLPQGMDENESSGGVDLAFWGSMEAFKVILEKDISKYPSPEPLQLSYRWYYPRLRQVYGSDVVVDIEHVSDMKKILRFYWASEVGRPAENASEPQLIDGVMAFRTITLETGPPTMQSSSSWMSVRKYWVEDGARHFEVERADTSDGYSALQRTLKAGTTRGASDLFTYIDYNDWYEPARAILELPDTHRQTLMQGEETRWIVEESDTTGITSSGGRQIQKGWNTTGLLREYSGPAWELNGAVSQTYGNDVHFVSMQHNFDDQIHHLAQSWDGKISRLTRRIGEDAYTVNEMQYSDNFQTVTLKVDEETTATLTYHGPGEAAPWTLKSVEYVNQYRQTFTPILGIDQTILRTQSGWGEQYLSGTDTITVLNAMGGLISEVVGTTGGIPLNSRVGYEHTPWGVPRELVGMRGETSTMNFEETGPSWGMPLAWTTPLGVSGSVTGYDALSRPVGWNTGFTNISPDYNDPYHPSIEVAGQDKISASLNPFGELTQFDDERPGGVALDLMAGKITVDGREANLNLTAARQIVGREGGLGSRGATQKYKVEVVEQKNRLCLETTHLNKTNEEHFVTKTIFDGHGRVIETRSPGPTGPNIVEKWSYDDANRSVTYTPPAGGFSKAVTYSVSDDGATLSMKEGNAEIMKQERSVAGNRMVLTTTLMDDSGGGATVARQISRQEFEPSSGTSFFTPWDIATAKETFAQSAPGAETTLSTSGGGGNDYRTVTLSQGRPSRVEGRSNGQAFDLNAWTYEHSRLERVEGTIGGKSVSLEFDGQGRVSRATGPGYDKAYTYEGAPGYLVSVVDSEQSISQQVGASAVGDFIELDGNVSQPLTANSNDLPDGIVETVIHGGSVIHGGLKVTTAPTGEVKNKNYNSGGIVEDRDYDDNGAIRSGGVGNTTNFSVTYGNDQQSIAYGGGGPSLTEEFYQVGLRKRVSGSGDNRSFTWFRGSLASETHHSPPWSGASIRYGQDNKGRFNELVMEPAQSTVAVDYEYENTDQNNTPSRPYKVICGPFAGNNTSFAGTYTYTTAGQLETFRRGPLVTTWNYDNLGRCTKVTTGPQETASGVETIGYSYGYNQRNLRESRTTTNGLSWFSMGYDGRGRFTGWKPTDDSQSILAYGYGYDTRNNVVASPAITFASSSGPDQYGQKNQSVRSYGVHGRVAPGATVKVFHPLAPQGETLAANVLTGAYEKTWTVDANFGSGGVTHVDLLVRGTLAGAGNAGTDAVADKQMWVSLPAVNESLEYDAAGRLEKDGRWTYQWNGATHLKGMVRDTATIAEPGKTSETLTFTYDLDGRRTGKESKSTYLDATDRKVESKMLWSGWLPVMEERVVNGQTSRRWFIWGRDVSGSWDGAGGVGGLAAIIEEGGRVLLPVEDGLGNIIAVVNQATGATVARYDYSPYGELLSQSGEVNACPFRWQSKLYDEETGLYYFGYRYYDPKLCRWISRDPLGEAGGFNLYAYCGNDPVNKRDYLGMWPLDEAKDLVNSAKAMRELREAREQANIYAEEHGGPMVEAVVMPWELPGYNNSKPFFNALGIFSPGNSQREVELSPKIPKGSGFLHSAHAVSTSFALDALRLSTLAGHPAPTLGEAEEAYWSNFTSSERSFADWTSFGLQIAGPGVAQRGGAMVSNGLSRAAPYMRSSRIPWRLEFNREALGQLNMGVGGLPLRFVRKDLPDLADTFAREFEGGVRVRTLKAGTKLYRSPWVPDELPSNPGGWFGMRQAAHKTGADSMYQITKWGNPNTVVRSYELLQDVTLYYGRVKGGTGYQVLFPKDIVPADVLRFVDELLLKK